MGFFSSVRLKPKIATHSRIYLRRLCCNWKTFKCCKHSLSFYLTPPPPPPSLPPSLLPPLPPPRQLDAFVLARMSEWEDGIQKAPQLQFNLNLQNHCFSLNVNSIFRIHFRSNHIILFVMICKCFNTHYYNF
jgi:hypothetical protein